MALENGERIATDRVVLATGNPAPRPLEPATGCYFNSPWDAGALTGLDPKASVLLIGSGLTAVDAFLALEAQGHRGTIYGVSRRGKLSHVHTVYRKLPEPFVPSEIRVHASCCARFEGAWSRRKSKATTGAPSSIRCGPSRTTCGDISI